MSDVQPSGQTPVCKLASGLYLVATRIGNMGDISRRAYDTLASADRILCEDTRMTRKLLSLLGLSGQLHSYHEHNAKSMESFVLEHLAAGEAIALVSDAGLPIISDPGQSLVGPVMDAGFKVTVVPGANAVLPALMLSGLSADRFFFAGFLPPKKMARRQEISALASIPATLIFYESPQRAGECLADLAEVLGPRPAALVRELTKLHEEVRRGTLAELAAYYAETVLRGEIVLVVGASSATAEDTADAALDVGALLEAALSGGAGVRDAAAVVAARTGLPRREVYAKAVALASRRGGLP